MYKTMYQTYCRIATWSIKYLRNSNRGKIYVEALNSLKEDVSPVYNDLGCAESVSTILQRANKSFSDTKGIVSTAVFYNYFINSQKWKETHYPQAGDVVVSPTGYGTGGLSNGHIGIVGVNNMIMSNNSSNSLLEENYTIKSWKARYIGLGGFPVKFYRAK